MGSKDFARHDNQKPMRRSLTPCQRARDMCVSLMRRFMRDDPSDIMALNLILAEAAQAQAVPQAPADSPDLMEKAPEVPDTIAILPLRGVMVYPLSALPLRVSQARSIKLIDDAMLRKTPIGLVASKVPDK